jgi:uncharacterized membrane protein
MGTDAAPDRSDAGARGRIDALSDGVFAIALTLLTLNVRLVQGPHETFAHALGEAVPELLTYGLSFAVIALFWIGHHRLFALLAAVDHTLLLSNFAFLAIVALVPFPTQVLGRSASHIGPVILYASVLLVGCCISGAMWFYAKWRGLFVATTSATLIVHSAMRALLLAFAFAISIPVAIVFGAHAGEWTWLIALPARILLARRYGSVHDIVW